MPGCCIPGCTNSTKKGFSMRAFPTDPNRRKEWIASINVQNWKPSKNSRICEEHFSKNMWEKVRCDGKKKLKGNAVPGIFPTHTQQWKDTHKTANKSDNDLIANKLKEEVDFGGGVNLEHQLHFDINKCKPPENLSVPNLTATFDAQDNIDWRKQCEELKILLEKSKKSYEGLYDTVKTQKKLFSKIIVRKNRRNSMLIKHIKQLTTESRNYKKLISNLRKVFNKDQIEVLKGEIPRGYTW